MQKVLVLGEETFEVDENDFTVDRSDIDNDLAKLPRKLVYYGNIEAKARLLVETRKANLTRLEADLDDKIRIEYKGDKRQTEAQVKNEIIRNEEYQKLQKELLETQYVWNTVKWILNALNGKKDIGICIGYRERQLMKMDGA